jgi:hypothetical protein
MSPQLMDTELWAKVVAWRPPGVRCGDTSVGCHVALRRLVGGSRRFVSHAPRNTAVKSRSQNSGDVLKSRVSEVLVSGFNERKWSDVVRSDSCVSETSC